MPELKPCPFCGSLIVLLTGDTAPAVTCFSCGAIGPDDSDKEGAAEAWNQRATPKLAAEGER